MAFSLGLYFSIIPWTDHYKNSIQNRKAVPPLKKDRNFNLTISEDQLHKLYSGLMRHDLLNSEKTNLQDFKNVLTKNWIDHNSKIHFNMDGPSCREFYEYLVKTFPNNTMTLKNLISSKLFIRADGKFYKYNTLKNAPTKTLYSKNYKEMQQIFDKIGGNF